MRAKTEHLSWRTFALMVGGSALLVVLTLLGLAVTAYLPATTADTARGFVSDAGSLAFGLLAAGILFYSATLFPSGNPLRRIWLLLGIGMAVRAIGDIIWIWLEVSSRYSQVPYPSAADVFYLSFYVFMVAGLILAARSFGRSCDSERAVKLDIIVMFVISVLVYTFIVAPIIVDPSASLALKALGAAYQIGDLVAILGPALFIAFVAGSVARPEVARQWWLLALGLTVMSVTDILFTWLDQTGRYFNGHPVDYAWMLSLLLIAMAGSEAGALAERRQAHVHDPSLQRRRDDRADAAVGQAARGARTS